MSLMDKEAEKKAPYIIYALQDFGAAEFLKEFENTLQKNIVE